MEKVLRYLERLEENNDRTFYGESKKEREEATREFEEFLQSLIFKIGEKDESVLGCIVKEITFKMVRDTRFSADKSPYLPAMRAHIGPKGKLPIPVGYYVSIMPRGRSFLGGGLFADMFTDATRMLREYVAAHGEELERIVNEPAFQEYFTVKGVALKKVPSGFDPENPYADWLKYKCMYLEFSVTDEQIVKEDFVSFAAKVFLAMKPFNDFLNRALKDFKMPARS